MNQKVIEKFWNLLGKDRVLVDEPMKCHTTFRIGGPADFFLLPSTVDEVRGILEICREEELPYFILGNGSNLLVMILRSGKVEAPAYSAFAST